MDKLHKIQELAPTEKSGRGHAAVRNALAESNNIGHVTVERLAGNALGSFEMDGDIRARVIVMSDGVSRQSGSEVFTPVILLTTD